MVSRKKASVLFLFIFLIAFIISIGACGHDCMDSDCKICYEIDLLRSIFDIILNIVVWCLIIKEFASYNINFRNVFKFKYNLTPVLLKVKLSE